jgi:hypothetical protein
LKNNSPNQIKKEKVGKFSTIKKKREKEYPMPMPPYLLPSFFLLLPHSPNNVERPTLRDPPTGVPFICVKTINLLLLFRQVDGFS